MRRLFCRFTLYSGFSAILLVVHASAFAQVPKVKDINLDSKRDRSVLFDMAVTPTGDVLSFVAKGTGDWELYRVSNWLGETPSVKKLVLPGYFSKADSKRGEKAVENLNAAVFVTRDGSYAVCKLSVLGLVDDTHAAATELFYDAVMGYGLPVKWLRLRHVGPS